MAQFKARARALDLLGRQQIAGIPTAINELFKNAHDAYADNAEIDYFRKEKLLVLRDNGLGMTRHDFETRWLTLGTESKFSNRKIPAPPKDPNKQERPIMGEKGIGRLAIASIGNQVLILTKAKRKGETHPIIAAFINWSIFELPGLNLEDVIIPIREFQSLPTEADIDKMKQEIIDSINHLVNKDDITFEEGKSISDSINSFSVSPLEVSGKLLGNFSLGGNNSGTHFFISPVAETLNNDIDGNKDEAADASKVEKMLVGFTNTMTPGHPKPLIEVAFRDFKGEGHLYTNILDKEEFFTPEDVLNADHLIKGEFDEYGQFQGSVTIYREKTFKGHRVIWDGNNFKQTLCGPFSINFAYLQGTQRDTIVDPENWGRIRAKADKYGGLYIYRDNIRILPYGDSDYDFLDIEKNRTKSLKYYFFSHRRMFGVIDITRKKNPKLQEKAGREGFIENKAYKQVQDILKNFFVQLAADFFREGGGEKTEFWVSKRSERKKIHSALEKRAKQSKVRKEKFTTDLSSFFEKLSSRQFSKKLTQIQEEIVVLFDFVASIDDPEMAAQALIDQEIVARRKIEDFKKSISIPQPRGFAISKETRRDYEAYLSELEKLENSILADASGFIDTQVTDYTTRFQLEINKRKRLEQAVEFISSEAKKVASSKKSEANTAASEISRKVKELANELMIDLNDQILEVKDRFKTLNIDGKNDFDLVRERKTMETDIIRSKDRATETLERIIRQLQEIYWERGENDEIITSDQINDAINEELEELRDRVQADIELSQLGLAVGVIQHEFSSTIKSIRSSIRDLKAWTDVNDSLEGVYSNIKINFEHLDGYLNLFTPLNRRLYRKKEDISALDIKYFLLDLFKPRLERHQIKFKHTKSYASKTLYGYRSTLYPVFVNLIDNAIHWLNRSNQQEKIIGLHADDSGVYISNNGPEISAQDQHRIFELGFTRKMNGRGLGLHISKEVLNAENHTIFLDVPRLGFSVTFKIEPIKTEEDHG